MFWFYQPKFIGIIESE